MSNLIGIILCLLMAAIAVDTANSQTRIFTTYAGAYSSGYSYNINDMTSLNGTFYMSLQSANQGNAPASSPNDWLQMGDTVGAATASASQSDPVGAGTTAVNVRFGTTLPTIGQIPIGVTGGGSFAPQALSGDCTLTNTGEITCLGTNGVVFGSAATTNANSYDAAGTAASLIAGSLKASNNLSDLVNVVTARTNLGLGTAATTASTAYDAAGTAATNLTTAETYSSNASHLTSGTITASLIPTLNQSTTGNAATATLATTATNVVGTGITGTTLASNVVTSSLTSVGTIVTGVWHGTIVANVYGGTGINTASSTGIAQVNSGSWTVSTAINPTTIGATTPGAATFTTENTVPVTVTSSATPALVATNGLQIITLSANATPTVTGLVAGQRVTIEICQPASGGPYTWTWPTSIHGGMTIGTTASACSVQSFDSFNGTTLVAIGTGESNVAP